MRKTIRYIDMPLFLATIILSIFGLVMIFSSSSVAAILRYDVTTYHFFTKQLIFEIVMFIIGFVFILLYPTKKYNNLTILLLLITFVGLLYLAMGGSLASASNRSINLKYFALQPAEFAKLGIILFSGLYYNKLLKRKNIKKYEYFIPLGITALLAILVFKQPDLGSTIILFLISYLIYVSIPIKKDKSFHKTSIVFSLLVVILGAFILKPFLSERQMKRFEYKAPCSRYRDSSGYQVCNGFIAIKNGGWFGVGFGESKQKSLYLPESHTDFIFPIIIEETGLIVGFIVLFTYLFILFKIYKIAQNTYNIRNSIIAYGTFLAFLLHILVNLLGVLALIPLTGVPLPLLSYGGSSTILFTTLLFIVQRINIENKQEKLKIEIKSL